MSNLNTVTNIGSVAINKQNNIKASSFYLTNPVSFTLGQLGDVVIAGVQNNDALIYDQATNKFVMKTIPIIDGGTF